MATLALPRDHNAHCGLLLFWDSGFQTVSKTPTDYEKDAKRPEAGDNLCTPSARKRVFLPASVTKLQPGTAEHDRAVSVFELKRLGKNPVSEA